LSHQVLHQASKSAAVVFSKRGKGLPQQQHWIHSMVPIALGLGTQPIGSLSPYISTLHCKSDSCFPTSKTLCRRSPISTRAARCALAATYLGKCPMSPSSAAPRTSTLAAEKAAPRPSQLLWPSA